MTRNLICFVFVVPLFLSLFTGCFAQTGAKVTEPSVPLKIMLPGQKSPDFDLVIREAENRMKAESFPVKLEVEFVPWQDFGSKSQVALASGKEVDLIFDAPWLHLGEMIADGYYEPLDSLLDKYGATIKATRSKEMWEANRFGGKIIAIPLGVSHIMDHSYFVRKDIREKWHVPPIRTYDDLIRFAYLVKEREPGISPLIAAGSTSQQLYSWATFRHYDDFQTQIRPTQALGNSLMLYYANNDGVVHNLFQEKDSVIRQWVKEARKLYLDGIMDPNVLGVKDFQEPGYHGKAAIFPAGSFVVGDNAKEALQSYVPQGEFESVTFFHASPGENISNFAQWNFIAVPAASKHKAEAIRFLDWANRKENYDLLAYGIEGKHWTALGTDKYTVKSSQYIQPAFVWIWNPADERMTQTMDDPLEHFIRKADNFKPDILTGFQFDAEPVRNEIKLYTRLEEKYYPPLFNGVVDPDTAWKRFEDEAGSLLLAIQRELQKQIQSFLKSK